MSFYVGCSSYISSSSSSSSNSNDDLTSPNYVENMEARLEEMDEEEALLHHLYTNNNILIAQCLNEQNYQPRHRGGAVHGHRVINRDREVAQRNLWNDYFADNPRYNDVIFRRRFRMGRPLFLRIVEAVENHDGYFVQRKDGLGRLGLTSLQKITAVFRMLAYGAPADSTDEYVKIGESTSIKSMKRFCRAIVEVFGDEYLRSPNANDVARLLEIGEKRGFPGMLGSLDCMHWTWKNCPSGWAGHYSGRSGTPSIILEAVADYDLWIWHAYFGLPGSNNDINVLEASHLFANIVEGTAPPAHYVIGGKEYEVGYYLADGIYPQWSTLVQTIHHPQGQKKKSSLQ